MEIKHLISCSTEEAFGKKRRLSSGWDTNRPAVPQLEPPLYYPAKRPRQDNFLLPNPDSLQETVHSFNPINPDPAFPVGLPGIFSDGPADDLSRGSLQGFGEQSDAYAAGHFSYQLSETDMHSTRTTVGNCIQEYTDFSFYLNGERSHPVPNWSPYDPSASWMSPLSYNSLSLSNAPFGDDSGTYNLQTEDKFTDQSPHQQALSLAQSPLG